MRTNVIQDMLQLETERLILRLPQIEDFERYAE